MNPKVFFGICRNTTARTLCRFHRTRCAQAPVVQTHPPPTRLESATQAAFSFCKPPSHDTDKRKPPFSLYMPRSQFASRVLSSQAAFSVRKPRSQFAIRVLSSQSAFSARKPRSQLARCLLIWQAAFSFGKLHYQFGSCLLIGQAAFSMTKAAFLLMQAWNIVSASKSANQH